MRTNLIAYGITAAVFLLLDAAWLGTMVSRVYRPRLASLLLDSPRLGPALLFYALYVGGITFFAVVPGLQDGGWRRAALLGAALGLVAYGTYDLTNLATLRGWSVPVTVLDLAWGSIATAAAAAGATLLAGWMTRAG